MTVRPDEIEPETSRGAGSSAAGQPLGVRGVTAWMVTDWSKLTCVRMRLPRVRAAEVAARTNDADTTMKSFPRSSFHARPSSHSSQGDLVSLGPGLQSGLSTISAMAVNVA